MSVENYDYISELGRRDHEVLVEKGQTYGSSWRNRGGVGAFMMLARKWDRIENQCKALGYDIFRAVENATAVGLPDDFLDDLRDLRRYLFLVDAHCTDVTRNKLKDVGPNAEYLENSKIPAHIPVKRN